MKKGTRIFLILLISILILLVVGATIFSYVQKYTAKAEELSLSYEDIADDAILNFNQLFDPTTIRASYSNITYSSSGGLVQMVGTNSNSYNNYTLPISEISVNCLQNHKYYFRVIFDSYLALPYSIGARIDSSNTPIIFYPTTDQDIYTYYYEPTNDASLQFIAGVKANTYYNNAFYLIFIDLTLMYGQNFEPTLSQCNEIFTSQVYSYTTGTPISKDTMTAYNMGIEAVLKSTKKIINTANFLSSVYAVNLDSNYAGTISVQNDTSSVYLNYYSTELYATCCLPFYTKLSAGTQITIYGECASDMHGGEDVQVGFYNNGIMTNAGALDVGWGDRRLFRKTTLTFTLPYDTDRMYIYWEHEGNQGVYIRNFEVSYYATDLELLKANSYLEGYTDAESEYAVGTLKYNEIYNAGINYAMTHDLGNSFSNAFEFISTTFTGLGGLLQIELIPGVPMATFVLLPLMVALIFFIVRLVKGGGD